MRRQRADETWGEFARQEKNASGGGKRTWGPSRYDADAYPIPPSSFPGPSAFHLLVAGALASGVGSLS